MAIEANQLKKIFDEESEIDVTREVLSTALKTAYRLFISMVLITILIFGIFPFTAMKFFDSVGLKERALDMANIYVLREGKNDTSAFSKYADGLYYKMMLSEELYLSCSKNKSKQYLEDIYDSTYAYSVIKEIDERNSRIDRNNLLSVTPIVHASVFSFKDRINNLNYFASIRLGKSNEFLIDGEQVGLDSIIAELKELSDVLVDGGLNLSKVLRFSIFFGQLCEYINYNLNENSTLNTLTLLSENDDKLLNTLEQKLIFFKNFALSYYNSFDNFDSIPEIYVRQTQLYLTRCVGRMCEYLFDAAEKLGVDVSSWDELRQVDFEGDKCTIMSYYMIKLLPEYVSFYNQNVH